MAFGSWKTAGSYDGAAWKYPHATQAEDGLSACYEGVLQEPLTLTNFAFGLAAAPLGVEIEVRGSRACWNSDPFDRVVAQLVYGGIVIGASMELVIPIVHGSVTGGGAADLWSAALSQTKVNDASFGVRIFTKQVALGGEVRLDLVRMRVNT